MQQLKLHMVTIEDLVPQEHFLRKLDAVLDLSFVTKETAHLYNHRYGRPPIDPVIHVKYLLLGFLYGIESERQIEQRVQTDVAMRWYLELDLFDRVPDHSTISQLRRRKPSFRKIIRRLFEEVVKQCVEKGLVSGKVVATDSTHVKANASRASEYLVDTEEEAGAYIDRLDRYEEQAREELERRTGLKRRKRTKQVRKTPRRNQKRVSRTDPDAGYMNRPGKPLGMHYLSHQTLDTDHGIILEVTVTPGNSSDSEPYLEQIERVHERVIPVQIATADAAYDVPLFHQELARQCIDFFVRPGKHSSPGKVELTSEMFTYDAQQDLFICPNDKQLRPKRIRRSPNSLFLGYTASREDCQSCPLKEKCLSDSIRDRSRLLERSYFAAASENNLRRADEPEYQEALLKRQIWSEGSFAVQKRGHNLRQLFRRGLEAAEDHCLLSATALNLKRMIKYAK